MAQVELDDDSDIFHGEIINIRYIVTLKNGESLNAWVTDVIDPSA